MLLKNKQPVFTQSRMKGKTAVPGGRCKATSQAGGQYFFVHVVNEVQGITSIANET